MATSMALKPGATYVYERADGIVYAREHLAHPSTRQVVGYARDHIVFPNGVGNGTVFGTDIHKVGEMVQILEAAKTNPALQDALDRAIIIYKLANKNE